MNKANTSDKETSSLDLNSKVIGSNIHASVSDKRDDFGLPIVIFPWLSGDVPRLPSYEIYISQLVRFARCCTSVFDFHSKHLQITSKLLTQGYRYHKLRKTFGKFFRSYKCTLNFCLNLVQYRFRIMYHKESLTLSSTMILSTNIGGSNANQITFRRAQNSEIPATSSV